VRPAQLTLLQGEVAVRREAIAFSAKKNPLAHILPMKVAQIHCGTSLLLFLRRPDIASSETEDTTRSVQAALAMVKVGSWQPSCGFFS
jgi:hypothetical protein